MDQNAGTLSLDQLPIVLEMEPRQKALRDLFVSEYLVDFSQTKAAMRCGFPRDFAQEWGTKLMAEAYVQQKLQAMKLTKVDEAKEAEFNTQRVKNQLLQEAHYHGPGSSHAARVSALAKLAAIYGMEAPKKTEIDFNQRGGVMRVPGAASLEDWEKAAVASQEALTGVPKPA